MVTTKISQRIPLIHLVNESLKKIQRHSLKYLMFVCNLSTGTETETETEEEEEEEEENRFDF